MPAARRTPPPPPSPSQALPFEPVDGEGGTLPEVEPRKRSAKFQKLEEAVAGIYILLGGGISTLPQQFVPVQFKAVGFAFASSSDEIAAAWIDLAEDDKRVLRALESLTSFSGWGKVIGVHLIAVGASVPGVAAVMPGSQPQQQQQPNGVPGMDMESMMMLGELLRMAQSEQRAPEQPPQQAAPFAPPAPQPEQQQQPRVRTAPPPPARPRAGMPSAADLGATQADIPVDFPTAGSDSIRG